MVYVYAKRLECALTGLFDDVLLILFRQKIECLLYNVTKLCGRSYAVALPDFVCDCLCKLLAIRLIWVLIEHTRKLLTGYIIKPLCCTDTGIWIKTQIQRSIHLKRKSTLRIIYLHWWNSQIGKYEIKASYFLCNLIYCAEVLKLYGENILSKTCFRETLFCLFRLDWVNICSKHMSMSFKLFKHCPCVATVSECGIKACLSRLYVQKIYDFFYHYGYVHARRGISLADDMLNCILVFFRV